MNGVSTAAEIACDTHIFGNDDLLEVVATDLPPVSHRLPEQLFQPFEVAFVDPARWSENMNSTEYETDWIKTCTCSEYCNYLFVQYDTYNILSSPI